MNVKISGVASYLPAEVLTCAAVEARITAASPGFTPWRGAIRRLTGVEHRHVAHDTEMPSDLAVAAAAKLLADTGVGADELDLIIFGAASQDMLEPATSHVVAAKLGATCPVFDVKNACNSFLNGMQIAEALINSGQYRRVLICSGETVTRVIRWHVPDRASFLDTFAGFTLSDCGTAILLEASAEPGIRARRFGADSASWSISTVPGSGMARLHDPDRDGYVTGNGRGLLQAVLARGVRQELDLALADAGLTRDDIAAFCVHQVTSLYLHKIRDHLEIPQDKVVMTIAEYGNVASCTLPLQLNVAIESGRCGPGDVVALIGLAGGISFGIMLVEL